MKATHCTSPTLHKSGWDFDAPLLQHPNQVRSISTGALLKEGLKAGTEHYFRGRHYRERAPPVRAIGGSICLQVQQSQPNLST
jgi:hypothetical protein